VHRATAKKLTFTKGDSTSGYIIYQKKSYHSKERDTLSCWLSIRFVYWVGIISFAKWVKEKNYLEAINCNDALISRLS